MFVRLIEEAAITLTDQIKDDANYLSSADTSANWAGLEQAAERLHSLLALARRHAEG